MTVIDHNGFPHLIDLIWQYLDYEGQLAVRGACKDWMQRADSRLRHIVLTSVAERTYDIDFTSRDLSKPFSCRPWLAEMWPWHFSPHHEEANCDDDNNKQGGQQQFGYSDGDKLVNHLELRISSDIKVVDLVGFHQGPRNVPGDLSDNSFVRKVLLAPECMVRWYGHLSDLWDFGELDRNHHYDDRPPSLIDVFMFTLRKGVRVDYLCARELSDGRKVRVANYLCFSDLTASFHVASLWDEHPQYQELHSGPVTVILHNHIPQEDEAPLKMEAGLVAAYGCLVHGGSKVTVVGLEQFLELKDMEGYIETVQNEVMKGRHVYDCVVEDHVWWVPKGSCLNNLSFMTHEEYRGHVGEELYRLHTVR